MAHAYIYCRVSSKEQSNQLTGHISLEVQEVNCRQYAEEKGWIVEKVITEVGSGRNMKKLPNLMKLVNELRKAKQKAVLLFNNISRFSRNTLEALIIIENLKKCGVTIYSVQEQLDMNKGSGRHTFRILLSGAEYESDMISERVRMAFQLKRQLGSQLGTAPYGFEAVVEMGIRSFVENAYERDVITFICEAFKCQKTAKELTNLMMKIKQCEDELPINFYDEKNNIIDKLKPFVLSYEEIASLLNTYEVTKRGKTWTGGMVSGIIRKFCEERFDKQNQRQTNTRQQKKRQQKKNVVPMEQETDNQQNDNQEISILEMMQDTINETQPRKANNEMQPRKANNETQPRKANDEMQPRKANNEMRPRKANNETRKPSNRRSNTIVTRSKRSQLQIRELPAVTRTKRNKMITDTITSPPVVREIVPDKRNRNANSCHLSETEERTNKSTKDGKFAKQNKVSLDEQEPVAKRRKIVRFGEVISDLEAMNLD